MSKVSIATLIVVFALAGCATPQVARTTKLSRWSHLPSADEMSRTYPEEAFNKGVRVGTATLNCKLTATGHLTSCSVAGEAPQGLGFGAAALVVADKFVAKDLSSPGTEVSIPITWHAYY